MTTVAFGLGLSHHRAHSTMVMTAGIDQDELIADVMELLHDLVADGSLELATRYGPTALATPLAEDLAEETDIDLEEWLLDREEVVELFVDADTLKARIRPILTRLEKGDGEPKWNDTLAAAILANPDDANARVVFGDWLEQEGDPRGELVAVQSAIEEKSKGTSSQDLPKNDPLKRRESSLLERFRTHFFGDLTREERATFRYGFFDSAAVDGHQLDRLLAIHSSRFLRKLSVPFGVARGSEILEQGKLAIPSTIEELTIGLPGRQTEPGTVVRVSPPLKRLGRLHTLDIAAEKVVVDALEFPSLRKLTIVAREGLQFEKSASAEVKLPALTELAINTRNIDDDTALRELIASPPQHLTTLRLWRVQSAMELVRHLVGSPLLKQLKVLDLRRCSVGRADTAFLLENRTHFAHLERLDLRGLYLGDAEAQLAAICKDVAVGYEGLDENIDEEADDYYDGNDEDEDDEQTDGEQDEWDDPDLDDPALDEPDLEEDEVEEEIAEERQEPAGVDRDAPVEEHERYDEPVE